MSAAEDQLAVQLDAIGLKYTREFVFALPRKFRLDFFFTPDVACEVDGAVWTGGRHSRGGGILKDCEKYALAAERGIRIVRVTPQHVKSGEALEWIGRAINYRSEAHR
jgi:hypothetical protein